MLSADRNKTVWSKELTQTPSATKLFSQRNKRRRFPMEPSEIRQSLKVYGGSQPVVLIYQNRRKNELFNHENIGI